MLISKITQAMIAFSDGNIHDIDHFMRVWGYAKTIAELESLPLDSQRIIEAAALLHDIACPLCREKYGCAKADAQEKEGMPLAKEFLRDMPMAEEEKERVVFLVGHHHTLSGINGIDWQILIEADYIANASENGLGREDVTSFRENHFETASGKNLLNLIFGL
ncbi:MAG: HD domain-containing protein [Oscillospiraceae bacterium]|nr:HD domain-containing protein [Oscillospiraceae bacterium]